MHMKLKAFKTKPKNDIAENKEFRFAACNFQSSSGRFSGCAQGNKIFRKKKEMNKNLSKYADHVHICNQRK